MKFCKVVAIMNITDYNVLHVPIQQLDVPGVTVSMVKGFGDYVNDFSPFGFSENMKIEIYTTTEQAEIIAVELAALADNLTQGGGVIAIEPVHRLMNVGKLDLPTTE
jgi:nitrogen regulatory protein PII